MHTFLWIVQWVLAVFLLISFLSMPFLLRQGVARNNVTAFLSACFGLACGIGIVVPWLTGWAMILTPIAASLIALTSLLDGLTNVVPTVDALYLALIVLMAITVALGRFRAFGRWEGSFVGWAVVAGGGMLLVLCLLTSAEGPSGTRWGQAGTGLLGVALGSLLMLEV